MMMNYTFNLDLSSDELQEYVRMLAISENNNSESGFDKTGFVSSTYSSSDVSFENIQNILTETGSPVYATLAKGNDAHSIIISKTYSCNGHNYVVYNDSNSSTCNATEYNGSLNINGRKLQSIEIPNRDLLQKRYNDIKKG